MDITYIFIAGTILAAIVLALGAFYYAARDGQFRRLEEGARVIFDEEEPIGQRTDSFSDLSAPQHSNGADRTQNPIL